MLPKLPRMMPISNEIPANDHQSIFRSQILPMFWRLTASALLTKYISIKEQCALNALKNEIWEQDVLIIRIFK